MIVFHAKTCLWGVMYSVHLEQILVNFSHLPVMLFFAFSKQTIFRSRLSLVRYCAGIGHQILEALWLMIPLVKFGVGQDYSAVYSIVGLLLFLKMTKYLQN